MLRSLRSRLFVSYLLVSVVVLLLVFGTLVATTVFTRARSFETAIELNAVARPVLRDFSDAVQSDTDDVSRIRAELDETADRFDVRLIWVGQNQRIRYDSGGEWTGITVPDDVVPQTSANVLDSVNIFTAEDGRDWVFYSPPTAEFGKTFLILAKPEPQGFPFVSNALAQPIRRTVFLSLLLSGALSLLITRSVARPLQRLAKASEAVAQGDYDQQVPIAGPSEVREVATTFNAMTKQVKASQQSQRDFVANIGHDLKTPITSIQGWSQALLDGTADGVMVAKSAEIIHTEANRMSRMVQDLLDLARLESGTFTLRQSEFLLLDLLHRVRDAFLPVANEKGIALTVSAPNDLVISADSDRLAQILTNLIANALAHTDADGVVSVTAQPQASHIHIAVADTGSGIAADELPRIFERFYQVDKARSHGRKGTGLGLSIVKEIVEAHGGSVSAESRVGHGSTFSIRLPA